MKVNLRIIHKGTAKEANLGLGQIVAIGRSSKCDLQIEDEKMSGRHCRFFLKNDRLEVSDLDSKNGTYLNGIRIETSEVFVGDEIRVGDTFISLQEGHFDQEALDVLTFPGPHKDRMSYELKIDFTGARIQNQQANKKLSVIPKVNIDASHAREIDLRKKVKSKLKVSKEEIRSRHKITAFLASCLDAVFMFFIMSIPLILMNKFFPGTMTKNQKLISVLILEVASVGIFFMGNFKLSKFTIGERLSGIQDMYQKQ